MRPSKEEAKHALALLRAKEPYFDLQAFEMLESFLKRVERALPCLATIVRDAEKRKLARRKKAGREVVIPSQGEGVQGV